MELSSRPYNNLQDTRIIPIDCQIIIIYNIDNNKKD
jgi:hypothetical protein